MHDGAATARRIVTSVRPAHLLLALLLISAAAFAYGASADITEGDPINFTLGVERFHVPSHRPHPPGFPLFIALGKGATALLGNPVRGLQLVCGLGAVAGVIFGYLILGELFGRYRLAVFAAAVVAALTPITWYYSTMIQSDVVAGGLLMAALYAYVRFHRSGSTLAYNMVWLGLAALVAVRPPTLIPLLPLFGVLLFSGAGLRATILGVSIAAIAAGLPALWMFYWADAGTPEQIMAAVRGHLHFVRTMETEKSLLAALKTVPNLWFSPAGFGYLFTIAAGFLCVQVARHESRRLTLFLAAAILPQIAWLLYTTQPNNFRYWTLLFPLIGPAGLLGFLLALEALPLRHRFPGAVRAVAMILFLLYAAGAVRSAYQAVRIQRTTDVPLLAAAKFTKEYGARNPKARFQVQIHLLTFVRYAAPELMPRVTKFYLDPVRPKPGDVIVRENRPAPGTPLLFSTRRKLKVIRKLGIMRNFESYVYIHRAR